MLNMGCIMHWMKERKIKNEVIVNIDCLFESVFFGIEDADANGDRIKVYDDVQY